MSCVTAEPLPPILLLDGHIGDTILSLSGVPDDIDALPWVLVGAMESSAELRRVDSYNSADNQITLDRALAREHTGGALVYFLSRPVLLPLWMGVRGAWTEQDGDELRTACEELRQADAGTLFFPVGEYGTDLIPHPNNVNSGVGLWAADGIDIVGQHTEGAILRLRDNQAIVGGQRPNLIGSYSFGSPTETGMVVGRMTIDGNGNNQTHAALANINLKGVRRARILWVKSVNARGTAPSGDESFSIHYTAAADSLVEWCVSDVVDGSSSSSGITMSSCVNSAIENCESRNTTIAVTYGANKGWQMRLMHNLAQSPGKTGFNQENSHGIVYFGNATGGASDPNYAVAPYGLADDLGCDAGYVVNRDTTDVAVAGGINISNEGTMKVQDAGERIILADSYFDTADRHLIIAADTVAGDIYVHGGNQMVNAVTSDINVQSGSLQIRWHSYHRPSGMPATGTVTASPYPYTSAIGVSGGTVSSIVLTDPNGDARQVGTGTNMLVFLPPKWSIQVNYSSIPDWRWLAGV